MRIPYRGRNDDIKYCKYHRDYDHHRYDCYQLKEEIEMLIRCGKLKEYVTGDAVPMDTQARNDASDKPGVSWVHIYHIGRTNYGWQLK